jgi:hypothetical protein
LWLLAPFRVAPETARPHVLSQRLGALGWAALLPVVMLVCTVYWGVRPWTLTVLFVAGAIALLVPAVAADLLALALIGLGANAFALAKRGDPLPQGSGTTANYPLHTLVFGVLAISSPPGGPTIVVIEVPCALSLPKTSSC